MLLWGDMPRMIASMKVKGTVLDKTQTSHGARLSSMLRVVD